MLKESHYLRENKATGLPKRLLFLDTETVKRYEWMYDAEVHRFKMGYTWFVKGEKGVYSRDRSEWEFHDYATVMLRYIEGKCVKSSPLFVIGSNVLFDMGASGMIPWFTDRGWERDFYYSKGLTFMMVISKGGLRIKFLSMQNFLPGSIAEVGDMIGMPVWDVDFDTCTDVQLTDHCYRDCHILGEGMLYYLDFLRRFGLGRFRLSVSGQAMGAYRHRFMDEKILIYHEREVNKFERSAYYGGRVEPFRIGKCEGGPFVQLDVNGMYPYVMELHKYPVKLYQCRMDVSPWQMKKVLKRFSVVARCQIETDEPVYPVRIDGLTCFPIGKFSTTLCTGSVEYALAHGHLKSVERCTLYHQAHIFGEYVDFFWTLRKGFKYVNNRIMEFVCKLFLNSMYGKFGEQRDSIVDFGWVDDNDAWRQEYYNEVTESWGIEEVLFHKWTLYEGKEESPQSAPAIAAHVTDYARNYLWKLMGRMGRENVLYVDTDSMIIRRDIAYSLGYSQVSEKELGFLKLESEMAELEIFGCKDYITERKVVRKGIRSEAVAIGSSVFSQEQFPSIVGLMRIGCWTGLPVKTVKKHLMRKYKKGLVHSDGRVSPLVLDE